MTARILVVCTANVCRSPLAAALLADHLHTLRTDVVVASAGVSTTRLPVDPFAVRALREIGPHRDLSEHRPRAIDRDVLATDGADLIVTMTRAHLRRVVSSSPEVWTRTFTLRELVRRGANAANLNVAPYEWAETDGMAAWIARLGSDRRTADLVEDDPLDDIRDPYGLGIEAVRNTAAELDRLMRALAALIPWPRQGSAP